jgi:hypothetical protein
MGIEKLFPESRGSFPLFQGLNKQFPAPFRSYQSYFSSQNPVHTMKNRVVRHLQQGIYGRF